jgi:hypothetical protein
MSTNEIKIAGLSGDIIDRRDVPPTIESINASGCLCEGAPFWIGGTVSPADTAAMEGIHRIVGNTIAIKFCPSCVDGLLAGQHDIIKRLRARIAELEARESEADAVIARGVELMTTEQLSKWDGVRAWMEQVTP